MDKVCYYIVEERNGLKKKNQKSKGGEYSGNQI